MGNQDPTRLEKTEKTHHSGGLDVHLEKGASKLVGDEAMQIQLSFEKIVLGGLAGEGMNESYHI